MVICFLVSIVLFGLLFFEICYFLDECCYKSQKISGNPVDVADQFNVRTSTVIHKRFRAHDLLQQRQIVSPFLIGTSGESVEPLFLFANFGR